MKHKINPIVDCVFKALLGSEKNKNLLIHFLNAVTGLAGDDAITEVVIMNSYNDREFFMDKLLQIISGFICFSSPCLMSMGRISKMKWSAGYTSLNRRNIRI